MKNTLRAITLTLLTGAMGILSAASICPSTSTTTSDCNYLVTINSTGSAMVSDVAGSMPFNGPMTFTDGTMDPGMNGSLVGVVNNYSQALTSFTISGSGANAGIFDFSFNGICAYSNASYCATAASGYEGPSTTFSSLRSTVLFQTTEGNVNFNPSLATGASTYFAIENGSSDINANGGLKVSGLTFASSQANAPEPAGFALMGTGFLGLYLLRRKLMRAE